MQGRHRQRDGAPLEAHGLSTDGQPLELCRPVGEARDGEEGLAAELGRHGRGASLSSPSKTMKPTQKEKKKLTLKKIS